MKNTVAFALLFLIINGCALRKVERGSQPAPSKHASSSADKKGTVKESQTRAVFHVIEPLGVKLVLINMDKNIEEIVLMDKTLSSLKLSPGFWQVTGFILKGKRYKKMNTTKQFIFQVKKNKHTYVGSYIFQCPKVNQSHLREMKKMNFFNRYPYSSSQKLCELVVGSDFANVNRVWMNVEKAKHPLSLGF